MAIVSHPSDLLGQEELITHFGNLLRADKLPHALLLAGEEAGRSDAPRPITGSANPLQPSNP